MLVRVKFLPLKKKRKKQRKQQSVHRELRRTLGEDMKFTARNGHSSMITC